MAIKAPKGSPAPQVNPLKDKPIPDEVDRILTEVFNKNVVREVFSFSKESVSKGQAWLLVKQQAPRSKAYRAFHTEHFWVWIKLKLIENLTDWVA